MLIEVAKALAPIRLQLCKTVLQNGKKNCGMRMLFFSPWTLDSRQKRTPSLAFLHD